MPIRRRVATWLGMALACCAIFAAAAYAGGANVWLNWVWTGAKRIQGTTYKYFRQDEAEAKTHGNGCANAWTGQAWFWGHWFCANHGYGAASPAISCCYVLAPYVWNESGYDQYMWGWQWYY